MVEYSTQSALQNASLNVVRSMVSFASRIVIAVLVGAVSRVLVAGRDLIGQQVSRVSRLNAVLVIRSTPEHLRGNEALYLLLFT